MQYGGTPRCDPGTYWNGHDCVPGTGALGNGPNRDDDVEFDEDSPLGVTLVYPYLIVKVLEVQKVDGEGKQSRQYWDYSKEECPVCIVKE